MTQEPTPFNREKFTELVMWTAQATLEDRMMSTVKLERLLYYMDFTAHLYSGFPMTGATYLRYPDGPTPQELPETAEELTRSGELSLRVQFHLNQPAETLVPARDPGLSLFSSEELEIMHDTVTRFLGMDSRQICDHSKKEHGWKVTQHRQAIPYDSIFDNRWPLTMQEHEERWTMER